MATETIVTEKTATQTKQAAIEAKIDNSKRLFQELLSTTPGTPEHKQALQKFYDSVPHA